MRNSTAIISFTFDDFPRSALLRGGASLMRVGARGTYYASLGLIAQVTQTGEIFHEADLKRLTEEGHELGCHTFSHCHAYDTPSAKFERSLLENERALERIAPGIQFKTLSYPISGPNRKTKRLAGNRFACCRGGGQTYNAGTVDLNFVSAFFLEQSRENPAAITRLIDQNREKSGWLVFATHDISENPTRFGCEPGFFDRVVQWSKESGAQILPVIEALKAIASDRN